MSFVCVSVVAALCCEIKSIYIFLENKQRRHIVLWTGTKSVKIVWNIFILTSYYRTDVRQQMFLRIVGFHRILRKAQRLCILGHHGAT